MSGIDLPAKLSGLFQPHRYKVVYGGRGGAKSWSFARALLIQGAQQRKRILCCREYQKNIKDSVHKLLVDQITELHLEKLYSATDTSITSRNGTEMLFEGLRYNAEGIKSLEGVDIAWIEQAERVSKHSLDILIPTIRKDGSEIWVTINPELEEDPAYERFVVHPPPDTWLVEQNWRDNPWFPEVLRAEMEYLKKHDPDEWMTVWEGKCRHALAGAIYATELRDAELGGRICKVPMEGGHPVNTAWDLGHSDSTAIWFFQKVGFQYRLIDYFDDNSQKLDHYLGILQDRRYVYGRHFLPHDAESDQLGGDSIAEQMRRVYGDRGVVVVPRTDSVAGDLNICRTVFASCWFDREKTPDGVSALRHYRYGVDENTGRRSRLPIHDQSSHGADAFRTFAVGMRGEAGGRMSARRERAMAVESMREGEQDHGWMRM